MSTATKSHSNSSAVALRPREIKEFLLSASSQLAAVLPKHVTPEKMAQLVSNMAFKTPALLECSRDSILLAVLEASTLGLDLSPTLGEAYLIPRWNKQTKRKECQFQPGYQGLVKLAYNSGKIRYVHSRLVRASDHFQVAFTPDLRFIHEPSENRDAPITQVYAVAKLGPDDHIIEVMTAAEINAVRDLSDSYQWALKEKKKDTPWISNWPEMARKTSLRRLCKALPRSPELNKALAADDEDYFSAGQSVTVVSSPPRGISRSAALADRLAGQFPEPEFTEGTAGRVATEAEDTLTAGSDDEWEPGSDG